MNNEETRAMSSQQDQLSTGRNPWQKPEVEVLAINQTENGNTNPSGDVFTLS